VTGGPLVVVAPVAGTTRVMADVPDVVFAEEMVGPGVAVDPDRGSATDQTGGRTVVPVVSPVSGTVVKLHAHAFVVETQDGRAVLVHLGIDTVQLGGEGFDLRVSEGDVVSRGDVVVTWDPAAVEEGGRSPVCPVVALDAPTGAVVPALSPGTAVRHGEALFTWG